MRRDSWRSVPMMNRPPAGADLSGLAGDLRLVRPASRQTAPGREDLLVVGLGVAGGLGDQLVAVARPCAGRLGHVLGVAAQHDIGTAAGHVGGDGDRAELARLRDDLGLLLVVLGVQHVVLDALAGQHLGQQLVLLDGNRADQHRLALVVAAFLSCDDGAVLALLGLVHTSGLSMRASGGWWGSPRCPARRWWRTPPPRSWRYRSCRRACRTGGSSSGR